MNHTKPMKKHGGMLRLLTISLLILSMVLSMVPSAFAAQEDNYHDPAEHWLTALNRTNELDANAVVTRETFTCHECGKPTSFEAFRTPEYTRSGSGALLRGVKYSDGTLIGGTGKGDVNDGTPGVDAYYTGYHYTKAVCENCGTINSNMSPTDYGYGKNVYWLYDCAAEFYEKLPETVSYEYADSTYHLKTTTGGSYCCFCYGTYHNDSTKLEKHTLSTKVVPQPANQRFAVITSCDYCDYTKTGYVGAKSVIASYYGVVDGQPHTITVSDLSEAGVSTSIRYGNSADSCTMTSAPNYTKAGQYTVYYQITYTYKNVDMTENGVAYVWLRDESGNSGTGTGDSATCTHNYVFHDTVSPTCLALGYDRYLCPKCGSIEKRNYTNALGHQWQAVVIRDATCEVEGKTMEICHRCGEVKVTNTPKGEHQYETHTVKATCTAPGYTVKECSVCGDRHITNITELASHSFKSVVTAPTCMAQGYTTKTCTVCGLVIHTDYTAKLEHKLSDWIVDKPATTTEEGSQHKECENCGTITDTETIPKVSNQGITDGNGEAIVGGYLVIVTDTDTSKGVMGAAVSLSKDNKLSVVLPSGRLIDYADQTTVTVLIAKTKAPVADMPVSVTDARDNYSAGKTDAKGQITIPGTSGITNDKGDVTVGGEDEHGNRFTYKVKVEDFESTRPIPGSTISIGKTGTISVLLPDGTDMDANNRITVTVTDNKNVAQPGMNLIVKNDVGKTETGKTDKNGKLTVPAVSSNITDDKGDATVGDYNVNVVDKNKDPIKGAEVTLDKDGDIGVKLPDGYELGENGDKAEQVTVTVTDKDGKPVKELGVTVTDHDKDKASGLTDTTGKVTVPDDSHCAYIVGYTDGTFGPNRNMTRSEAAAIFARLLAAEKGDTLYGRYQSIFKDVASKAWYGSYVTYLESTGIAKGYSDGTYRPNATITRAEFVAMCVRFYEAYTGQKVTDGSANSKAFTDVYESYWAVSYIDYASANGWVEGYNDGTFGGDKQITRAEVVTIVNRLLEREADKDFIEDNLKSLRVFSDMRNKNHWAYYAVMEAANAHQVVAGKDAETWEK